MDTIGNMPPNYSVEVVSTEDGVMSVKVFWTPPSVEFVKLNFNAKLDSRMRCVNE